MVLDAHPWTTQVAWNKLCNDHDDFQRWSNSGEMEEDNMLSQIRHLPPANIVKLNVDESFSPENACMGGGGLIRDSRGNWIVGFV